MNLERTCYKMELIAHICLIILFFFFFGSLSFYIYFCSLINFTVTYKKILFRVLFCIFKLTLVIFFPFQFICRLRKLFSVVHQGSRGGSSHTHNVPNGAVNAGHGTSSMHNHSSGSQTLRSSAKAHGSVDTGGGSSVESYRRQHEISVSVCIWRLMQNFFSGFLCHGLRYNFKISYSLPFC